MDDFQVVENFFGVYLLYCQNPAFKGRTYIGYTVDPNRRLKQHNKGKCFGGAKRTSEKGPWSMVMIIHGFPNDIAALRFEWAWQHPHRSRRLKHMAVKNKKKLSYDFRFRVLTEMLQVAPWCRLPLSIRWLNEDFVKDFPAEKRPPLHMPICSGLVISKKVELPQDKTETIENNSTKVCTLCHETIEDKELMCLNHECNLNSHLICLSKYFAKPGEYIPVEGQCPACQETFLWGDIIRRYKGCYNDDIKIDLECTNNITLEEVMSD